MLTSKMTFAAIVASLNNTAGVIRNDHTGAGTRTVYGVAQLVSGTRRYAVSLLDAKYFSLNDVYLDDKDEAHVSTNSCGGVVEKFDLTMEQAILNYNEYQVSNMFCHSFLVDIHFLVDGKLVPVDLVTEEQVAEMQATANAAKDAWKARNVA